MNKKVKLNTVRIIFTVLGFILIGSGSYIARFNADEKVSVIAGIIASIGIGLLAFARTL